MAFPTTSAPSTGAPPAPLPTHACVRCGADCPIDVALCEDCNPLALQQPAATQAHGTIFLAIGVGVILLAVMGRVALSGIGPFDAQVAKVAPTATGLTVTIEVTNRGKGMGAATCRLDEADDPGIGPNSAYLTTPRIPAGGTATIDVPVTTLGSTARPISVSCQGP